MRTFGYLLTDERDKPKLWELHHHPEYNLVTFTDPDNPAIWGWTSPDNVWEVCSY